MNKLLKIFLSFATLAIISVGSVSASDSNNGAYGQPCAGAYGQNECFTNIIVNKMVQNPKSQDYVDNLGVNDERFNPGQAIKFQIKVTNTGNVTLKNIEVKDTLPLYLILKNDFGTYDANTREIKVNIDKLDPNETRTFNLEAKITDLKNLPANQGIICTINQVKVHSDEDSAEDNSGFCIQTSVNKVLPPPAMKQTPPTGAEMITLIGLIPAGLAGISLRKRKINN